MTNTTTFLNARPRGAQARTIKQHICIALAAVLLCACCIPAHAADDLAAWTSVYSLVKDGPTLWAGTGVGIERIDLAGDTSSRIIINKAFENKARRIIPAGNTVWIARKFDVVRCEHGDTDCREQDLRQSGEVVRDVAHDGAHTWLLLSGRVMRFDSTLKIWEEFHVFDQQRPDRDFRAMAPDAQRLWLGEAKGNICTLNKLTAELDCPLPQDKIPYHAWQGPIVPAGALVWFFHDNALMAYNTLGQTVSTYRTPLRNADPGRINSILVAPGGQVWYASHRTIGRFDPATETWDRSIPSSRGHSLYLAGFLGDDIILTSSHGLGRFDTARNALNYFSLPELFNQGYQPHTAVIDQSIWMGFTSGRVVAYTPADNGELLTILPPCPLENILEKNLEGLEASRMSLPLTLEHLAITQLEKHGSRIWGAARNSLAMHDRSESLWNVRFFPSAVRIFYLDDALALATAGGKLYLCDTDDITCTPPDKTISTIDKTTHLPTSVVKHRDQLIMATREGRVLSYNLRDDTWSTILDVPERWQNMHPAQAVLAGKTVWIARDNHLFRYRFLFSKNKLEHVTADTALEGKDVVRLCAPDDNHAVAVTNTHIHVLAGASRTETALPCGSSGLHVTPCIQRDNTLWVATSSLQSAPGSVFRVDFKKPVVTAIPIERENLTVYDIEPDGSTLWLGTSAGIFKLDTTTDPPELSALDE